MEVTQAPDANGLIVLNVREDLYSDGKEDWLADATLNKMRFPVQAIGGNPLPLGVLGDTYILENGWKIAPYEADHTLRIVGNLFAAEEPLVVDTVGNYRVRVQEQVATLVEVRTDTSAAADLAVIKKDVRIAARGGKKLIQSVNPTGGVPGVLEVYDPDDDSLVGTGDLYEDSDDTIGYRGSGIDHQGKIT
ncbi:MAG: hypothetical protein R3330_02815 [Saprospiraceae bacterium]|nr:hypothetical protein [Saprospiraceae bacterium]